ncbi:MAG: SufS family cysteine desulfurase [OM182 bacterium]|nr:MAG: SufS family cysteine desulfurase [OM182 bacterium]|tara:strand:- start:1993 stop:3195 length:1203 start_codon:yes stop_codon:yes gene_type:complete
MHDIRPDFPILSRSSRNRPLVYLDNGATTQKPTAVVDAIAKYYRQHNANVHRAAHELAEEATSMMEAARDGTRRFINAQAREEIVFTRGTTESINLVANVLADRVQPGQDIVISELEHHSNIVPWQLLAQRRGANIRAIAITDAGDLDLAHAAELITDNTAILAVSHISNGLGSVNPVGTLIDMAKKVNALTLIDGAQAVLHERIDVAALDCDFYVFSAHKMFGPTGIGILYGKLDLLNALPPWQGGGEMIERVSIKTSTYQAAPFRFEAGTPNIAGAVGLGAALEYLEPLPLADLVTQEESLVAETLIELEKIQGFRLIGRPKQRSSVISFLLEGAHPNDVGTLLDQQGIAVRAGHHCNMPLMDRLEIPGTVRASFSLYNNEADAEALIEGVAKATTFL